MKRLGQVGLLEIIIVMIFLSLTAFGGSRPGKGGTANAHFFGRMEK